MKIMCCGFGYSVYISCILQYQVCRSFVSQMVEMVLIIYNSGCMSKLTRELLVDSRYVDLSVAFSRTCLFGLCSILVHFFGDGLVGKWSYKVLILVL